MLSLRSVDDGRLQMGPPATLRPLHSLNVTMMSHPANPLRLDIHGFCKKRRRPALPHNDVALCYMALRIAWTYRYCVTRQAQYPGRTFSPTQAAQAGVAAGRPSGLVHHHHAGTTPPSSLTLHAPPSGQASKGW